METPEQQSDESTDAPESAPDPGEGGAPTPATLPSDEESEGDARKGDDEHDTDSADDD